MAQNNPMATLKSAITEFGAQEIELAKAEVGPIAKNAGKGAGMFGGAGVVALHGLKMLLLCVGFGFSYMWHAILDIGNLAALSFGFLTAALLWFIVAAILALLGKGFFKKVKAPEATIAEAKATFQAVGEAINRSKAVAGDLEELPSAAPTAITD